MFKISAKQHAKLASHRQEELHQRLLNFLRREVPHLTSKLEDHKLEAWIRKGHVIANRYEIKSDMGVAQFLCLSLVVNFDFWEQPEVKDYLCGSSGSPEWALKHLVHELSLHFPTAS